MALKATKVSNAAADNFRLLKGKFITSADGDGDYIAFDVPKKAFIHYLAVDIKTPYSAASTGTLTVGIKEPGVAINANQLAAEAAIASEVAGTKVLSVGCYLENGGVITLGIIKGDSAADIVARLFVKLSVIH